MAGCHRRNVFVHCSYLAHEGNVYIEEQDILNARKSRTFDAMPLILVCVGSCASASAQRCPSISSSSSGKGRQTGCMIICRSGLVSVATSQIRFPKRAPKETIFRYHYGFTDCWSPARTWRTSQCTLTFTRTNALVARNVRSQVAYVCRKICTSSC